jgi:hypothetical protein
MLFPKTTLTNEETLQNYIKPNTNPGFYDKDTIQAILSCQQMRLKMIIIMGHAAPFMGSKEGHIQDLPFYGPSATKQKELKFHKLDNLDPPEKIISDTIMQKQLANSLETAEKAVEKMYNLEKEYKSAKDPNRKMELEINLKDAKEDIPLLIKECETIQKKMIDNLRIVEGTKLISEENEFQDRPKKVTSTTLNYALNEKISNFLSSVMNHSQITNKTKFSSHHQKEYNELTSELAKFLEDINNGHRQKVIEIKKNIKDLKESLAHTPEDKNKKIELNQQLILELEKDNTANSMYNLSKAAHQKFSDSINSPSSTSVRQKIEELINVQDIIIKFVTSLSSSLNKDAFIESSQSPSNEKIITNAETMLRNIKSRLEDPNPGILKAGQVLSLTLTHLKKAKFDLETCTDKNYEVREKLKETYDKCLSNCLDMTKKGQKVLLQSVASSVSSAPSLSTDTSIKSSTAAIAISAQKSPESLRKNLTITIPE